MMVSSRSHTNTRSVLVSGAVGDTVLVRLPRPRAPRDSALVLLDESRDRLEPSSFRGEFGPSVSPRPFDGLSVTNSLSTQLKG